MSYVITTKYLPATNTRGSRIKATMTYGKSVEIPYPHELSGRDCHNKAVRACLKRNMLDHLPQRFAVGDSISGYTYLALNTTTDTITFITAVK